jgi:hypothetical protein
LLPAGLVRAAGHDLDGRRTTSLSATQTQQVELNAVLRITKLLRFRLAMRILEAIRVIDEAQQDPLVYGTNGLSDGPDPIDGSGQAGSGPTTPTPEEPGSQQEDPIDGDIEGSSLASN